MNKLLDESTITAFKRGNGFDFMRYFFALSVTLAHFDVLCGNNLGFSAMAGISVKGFFTMSGFLVFYSLSSRPDLRTYVEKRVRRIFPAYATAVLLCFLIGMAFTTLPLSEFLSAGDTWNYLAANLSFLNFLQPTLPGVFEGNPQPFLNGSLWSMKIEVAFYVSAPAVYYLMLRKNKHAVLWMVLAICLAWNSWFYYRYITTGDDTYRHIQGQLGSFTYFYAGAAMLFYLDFLLQRLWWLLPVSAALFAGCYFVPFLNIAEALPFACLLIGVGYILRPLNFMRRYDNISYGIYLFHFPVIQAAVSLGLTNYGLPLAYAVCMAIVLILAALSWHAVEKPILRHRWF